MTYINELISAEDRKRFGLSALDRSLAGASPSRDWAIDRASGDFIRILRTAAERWEPGDPAASLEADFHFRHEGLNYLFSTRVISRYDMSSWPGVAYGELDPERKAARVYAYFVRRISEMKAGKINPLKPDQPELLGVIGALRVALAAGCGGAFTRASRNSREEDRYVILKVAPEGQGSRGLPRKKVERKKAE